MGRWTRVRVAEEGPQVDCGDTHLTRKGTPCTNKSLPGKTFCEKHDPDRKARRPGALNGRTCTATAKTTGKQCTQPAMEGQLVCHLHGGLAPQSQRAAAEWEANKKAQHILAAMGVIAPVPNALEALQALAGEVLAWKNACASFVAALDPDQYRYESQLGIEQIRGEILLWERSLERAVETLAKLARVQVDERLARIEEAKAATLTAAFTAAIAAAGVPAGQAEAIRVDFTRRLRVQPALPKVS